MIARLGSFWNLAGPDLVVIAIILAVLSAPAVIAIPIVFYINRRSKKTPPLPPVVQSPTSTPLPPPREEL